MRAPSKQVGSARVGLGKGNGKGGCRQGGGQAARGSRQGGDRARTDDLSNLQLLCRPCNSRKASATGDARLDAASCHLKLRPPRLTIADEPEP